MCACVHACVTEVGCLGGRTRLVQPLYLLYFVLRVYDHKRTQSGAATEGDTTGEQQLKWTQLGTVRSGHARLVLAGDATA